MGRQLNTHEPDPMKTSTYEIWVLWISLSLYVLSCILVGLMKCLSEAKYNRLVLLLSGQMLEEVVIEGDDDRRDINQRSCRLAPGLLIPSTFKSEFYTLYAWSFPAQITLLFAYALNTVLVERVYEETCLSYVENNYTSDPHYYCGWRDVNDTSNIPKLDDVCSLNLTDVLDEKILCHSYFYDSTKIIIVLSGLYGLHKLIAIIFTLIIRWDQFVLRNALKIGVRLECCGVCSTTLIYLMLSVVLFYIPLFSVPWLLGLLSNKTGEGMLSAIALWPLAAFTWSCLMISYQVVKAAKNTGLQPYPSAVAIVVRDSANRTSSVTHSTNGYTRELDNPASSTTPSTRTQAPTDRSPVLHPGN